LLFLTLFSSSSNQKKGTDKMQKEKNKTFYLFHLDEMERDKSGEFCTTEQKKKFKLK